MTATSQLQALRDHATALGIETIYRDVNGQHHETPEHTLRQLCDVLEDDRVTAPRQLEPVVVSVAGAGRSIDVGTSRSVTLLLADGSEVVLPVDDGRVTVPPDVPLGCHRLVASGDGGSEEATLVVPPATMPRAGRFAAKAGLFVPAYALWERSSPLPSFTHLAALARRLPAVGIDVLATLPLYAAFLDEPFDASPYAPASRLHWNEVYLDDAALPVLEPPPQGDWIDWRVLARRRRRQLLEASRDLDPFVQHGIDRLVAAFPDVEQYARFRLERTEPSESGHPPELVRRSHLLAQFLADRQLAGVEGEGRAALALDLPIGGHKSGFETWAHPELFATAMTAGAPPDEFFADGQNWGFPPQLPGAGRRSGHLLWRRAVARAGRHASILRIDHVMGVQRLWWIPDGASAKDGAYVRYPREELLAVVAAEAAATSTTIIGEDLGTVPDEVTDALRRWDALGMVQEQFTIGHDHLAAIPARSVGGVRTHDMPAFTTAVASQPADVLDRYRRLVEDAVGHPIGEGEGPLLDAVLERLAASDAYLVIADLDDLIGERAPHNVPGQVLDTTWRRRLKVPLSDMLSGDVRRRLQLLSSRPGTR